MIDVDCDEDIFNSEVFSEFDGEVANLIKMANKSAVKLVSLVTRYFPGNRYNVCGSIICLTFVHNRF